MIKRTFLAVLVIGLVTYALRAKTRQNALEGQIQALENELRLKSKRNPFSSDKIANLDIIYQDPKRAKHLANTVAGIEAELTRQDFETLMNEGIQKYG